MRWITRLLIMTCISAVVAVGLSYVLQLDESASVFRTNKPTTVNESNIVDVVSKMPLHLRIRRVEVSHSIVSVDLLAVQATPTSDLLNDLYQIPNSVFSVSTNINQVHVRVLDGSSTQSSGTQLLVAADARRDKWLPSEPKLQPKGMEELQMFLDSHYRMTYTPKWEEHSRQKS
ncbi:hypothetical protein [Paenibacillus sp. YYML68]|uniref:hypothetical protein n=1 Tax=Paenibacillus sp. YYML68 TaxID=2909250 RepID=UPI002492B548|nr:hypothetical protein [Paenibacillus sp. YYML68]